MKPVEAYEYSPYGVPMVHSREEDGSAQLRVWDEAKVSVRAANGTLSSNARQGVAAGAPLGYSGDNKLCWFGSNLSVNQWRRLERNLVQDLSAAWPGVTLTKVRGITIAAYGSSSQHLYIDDVRFTNAMTTEHLTLGPGVIGHIWRQRSTDIATYAATDRWFHYDQVGSVLSESSSAGTLAQRHEQDAFGNTVANWQSYTWGGDQAGWHHNSKEYDGELGLVYMHQRWYDGKLGAFRSSAPYPTFAERIYTFTDQRPLGAVDAWGEYQPIGGTPGNGLIGTVLGGQSVEYPRPQQELDDLKSSLKDALEAGWNPRCTTRANNVCSIIGDRFFNWYPAILTRDDVWVRGVFSLTHTFVVLVGRDPTGQSAACDVMDPNNVVVDPWTNVSWTGFDHLRMMPLGKRQKDPKDGWRKR
ncbi:MAG: hypothetical protein SF028_01025 [Candidatus Sumerlaeia bacterium]|nr:hypothetical protein [Candidatus Sumerlaeia bacterium]